MDIRNCVLMSIKGLANQLMNERASGCKRMTTLLMIRGKEVDLAEMKTQGAGKR
jgi:hypothetical protein